MTRVISSVLQVLLIISCCLVASCGDDTKGDKGSESKKDNPADKNDKNKKDNPADKEKDRKIALI